MTFPSTLYKITPRNTLVISHDSQCIPISNGGEKYFTSLLQKRIKLQAADIVLALCRRTEMGNQYQSEQYEILLYCKLQRTWKCYCVIVYKCGKYQQNRKFKSPETSRVAI